MEMIKNLINEHGASLVSTLTESGFTAEQAQQFLPEAAQGISDAVGTGGVSGLLSGSGEGDDMASTIMSNIDIESIAAKVGIDSSMASDGLTALIPQALAMINSEGGGLSSLLGGEGVGKVVGMVGKLFNK